MPPVTDAIKKKSKLTKEEWREYTKTVWHIANVSHDEHPAVFPVEIPHRLIKLFSWHGETVLDPFAGIGTTAAAAVPLGRKVVCVDQSRKYTNIIRRDCGHLTNGRLTAADLMDVVHGDSRDLSFIEDGSVSLVVSSPPILEQGPLWHGSRESRQRGGLPPFPARDTPGLEGVLPCPPTRPEVLSGHRQREPAYRPWPVDVPARRRLRRHPSRNRIRDGHRDRLVEGWDGGTVGLGERATADLRQLSLSAELPVQERPRVHPRLLEAAVEEVERPQGRSVP